jgi:hypothetical protein
VKESPTHSTRSSCGVAHLGQVVAAQALRVDVARDPVAVAPGEAVHVRLAHEEQLGVGHEVGRVARPREAGRELGEQQQHDEGGRQQSQAAQQAARQRSGRCHAAGF